MRGTLPLSPLPVPVSSAVPLYRCTAVPLHRCTDVPLAVWPWLSTGVQCVIRVRCSLGLLATGRDSKAGGGLFGPGRVDSSVADMFHVPRVDEGTTVGTMFQFDDPSGEWHGVCVRAPTRSFLPFFL